MGDRFEGESASVRYSVRPVGCKVPHGVVHVGRGVASRHLLHAPALAVVLVVRFHADDRTRISKIHFMPLSSAWTEANALPSSPRSSPPSTAILEHTCHFFQATHRQLTHNLDYI